MLVLARRASTRDEGYRLAKRALEDGSALEKMRAIIEAQDGNPSVVDDPAVLPQAPIRRVMEARRDGYIGEMQVRMIGEAAVAMGAGRASLHSEIDPAVGFHMTAKTGERITRGQPLTTIYARNEAQATQAMATLESAIPIVDEPFAALPLISHRVTKEGVKELS
jgi:pyrimidine-nucleoside phosphorylase